MASTERLTGHEVKGTPEGGPESLYRQSDMQAGKRAVEEWAVMSAEEARADLDAALGKKPDIVVSKELTGKTILIIIANNSASVNNARQDRMNGAGV